MSAPHDVDMGRSRLILAIAAVLLAAFLGWREWNARRASEEAFNQWMSRNCAVGENDSLERELRRYSSRLEPRLEEAFLQGPPPALKAQMLSAEQRERSEVTAAIDAGKTHGLSPEEVSRLRTRSSQRVSDQDLDDYVEGYRSAAIAGLVVIGTDRARQFLQGIRGDPQHRNYWGAVDENLRSAPPNR